MARLRDAWLAVAVAVTAALYVTLIFLKPGGEGFGRGWNLIAFWIYASPVALIAGVVALWRAPRAAGLTRRIAQVAGVAGVLFPIVAMLIMRSK